ncbi:MAG: DoxX family protein [Rhodothermales bacterium]
MADYQRFFIGAAPRAALTDVGLLILRVVTGLALALAHGLGKMPPSDRFVGMVEGLGFPAPGLFAWGSGFAELVCGLLLAVGLLTRPAALFIVLNMTVVVFLAHGGDAFGDREKGLLFGVIALTFLIIGAGRYSVDALLRRRTGWQEVRVNEEVARP